MTVLIARMGMLGKGKKDGMIDPHSQFTAQFEAPRILNFRLCSFPAPFLCLFTAFRGRYHSPMQSHLHPADLFDALEPRLWICARTRPRWERKLCRWLSGHGIPHYLPTYDKTTISHRKRRTSTLPLFPGYVFVAGDYGKKDFVETGAVTSILKPRSDSETMQLDEELRNVWMGLNNGSHPIPIFEPAEGQPVRISSGPLQGTVGRYVRKGASDRLILWVDMLGSGATVEIPVGSEISPAD